MRYVQLTTDKGAAIAVNPQNVTVVQTSSGDDQACVVAFNDRSHLIVRGVLGEVVAALQAGLDAP